MLKIGEFSKLSRVSVRMLRHYDEVGLLAPSEVDPMTGYRYYSERQLITAGRIAALRALETAVQECQFIKPYFRRFLGKPLCTVHVLGRCHGNVQMTFPQGGLRKGFQNIHQAAFVGSRTDFGAIEAALSVCQHNLVACLQA